MNKFAIAACTLCLSLAAGAAEEKMTTAAATSPEKMTCGQMIKAKSVLPSKMSELMTAVTTYFDSSAADLAPMKSKEAKAEMNELKKLGKMHSEMGAKMKATATEMASRKTSPCRPIILCPPRRLSRR